MTQTPSQRNRKCCFYFFFLLPFISVISLFPACLPERDTLPQFATYHIVTEFPHDHNAFTQGLVFEDGFFYESTGRKGFSSVRKVVPNTGEIVMIHELPDEFFGEGLTIAGSEMIQLTWRSRVGFIYDKETFAVRKEFDYQTEGWGITYDGKRLIMSDGSATLYFLDPRTFQTVAQVEVRDENSFVSNLNELEFIKGEIYANVWKTNTIVRINPETGRVLGWINLSGLLRLEDIAGPVDVLNGIAYDARNDRIFVTGKLWPKIFQIELIPIEDR